MLLGSFCVYAVDGRRHMNSHSKSTRPNPISLRHDDPRPVQVENDREDRFFLTAAEATWACTLQAEIESRIRDTREKIPILNKRIQSWCESHPEIVEVLGAPAASPIDGSILVLVTAGDRHYSDMDDAVSSLELELFREFRDFRVTVFTVPSTRRDVIDAHFGGADPVRLYAVNRATQAKS